MKYTEIYNDFIRNFNGKDKFMFNAYYSGANISGIAKSRGETRYITEEKAKKMMDDLVNLCRENNILPPGYKDKSSPNFLANQRREEVEAEKRVFQENQKIEKAFDLKREERDKSYAKNFGEEALAEAKVALAEAKVAKVREFEEKALAEAKVALAEAKEALARLRGKN